MKKGTKFLWAVALIAALSISIPGAVSAQAYNYTYSYQNSHQTVGREQLIAQIYALLAQLQNRYGYGYSSGYGQSYSQYGVEVDTERATNIDGDEARLWGTVDLNDARSATVWFEYGLSSSNLNHTSRSGRIDRYTSEEFRADLSNLNEDERYYFRAVAQDPAGYRTYGQTLSFVSDEGFDNDHHDFDDDEPDVDTRSATDIRDDSARLRGDVDMNDYEDGLVFFAYGQDENDVEDVEDEDEFDDIDERSDDLQLIVVDRNLDRDENYDVRVGSLDEDEDYYYRICVEFDDDDNDPAILCGDVEDFTTDDNGHSNNNGDEPDAATRSASDIRDDSAVLRGDVDMNDFDSGLVFFAYGEDENEVEDVQDEDEFDDIDERGDDLQLVVVDRDLDDDSSYSVRVNSLDDDTDYFFRICVEYEDDDNDLTLECGSVEDFTTDD